MPRIPGVPTLDPVDKPMESPAEAGKPGEAVAQMGAVADDAAETGLAVDLYLKRAQQNVDETAFQNRANAVYMQYQDALEKTTKATDVADVTKQYKDNLQGVVKQFQKSPALVEIQQQADSFAPRIDHLGNVKTADLQVKESAVESAIQKQTLLPQLVNATRNGDKDTVDFINGAMDYQYAQREKAGLISHADVEKEKNADQIQFRTQLNESYISDADPKKRLAAIQQLKTGGSGPLDLQGIAAGDIAALRTQAEAKNEQLNNLAEAGNLNRSLDVVQNAFQAPEYKNNYEARINSLQDGEWLQQHGIVAEDGSPDRVMAEKLIAETNRQRAEWEKETADRDDKAASKISPLIDENKISLGQLNTVLDQTEGISPKVRASLVAKWRANTNENIRLGHESYEIGQQMKAQKSAEVAADFYLKIAQGGVPSTADILTAPGLTKADQSTVLERAQKARADKPYQEGLSIIANAYPVNTKTMSVADQNAANEYQLRTMQAYDQEINAHPDEDKSVIASRLVMPGIVSDAIKNSIPATMVPPVPIASRLKTAVTAVENFITSPFTADLKPGQPGYKAPTSTGPKDGDKKKNSAGDPIVYRDGKWGPDAGSN